MSIISSTVAPVSASVAPNSATQPLTPAGQTAQVETRAQAIISGDPAVVVSLGKNDDKRPATYGRSRSVDASFERERGGSATAGEGGGKGSRKVDRKA